MGRTISIDELADVIAEGLKEYADLATEEVKSAVKKSAKAVKDQINGSASVRSGRYAKSWKVKTTAESANGLEQTVYSPNRYMLSHLLEKGMRNGAAAGCAPFPTLRRRKRWASRCSRA